MLEASEIPTAERRVSKPFKPDPPDGDLSKERLELWLRLLKASGLIEEELRRRFRSECNSTLPRFDVMATLAAAGSGLKMSEISAKLRVSNGNITGIVDKLSEEGIAARVPLPRDRRAHLVQLTDKGRKVYEDHAKAHAGWIDEILSGLNADDIEGMILRLDYMTKFLESDDD